MAHISAVSFAWILALAFISLSATSAAAHPHVFAEARLDVVVNPDGTVKSLRHLWRFDEMFTSTVILEFDKNGDKQLDDAELQEAAKTINASISEYKYFQVVTLDGKTVEMQPPPFLMTDIQDERFIIMFESAPKEPLKLAGKLDFGVYDPTFYTAIDFTSDDNMTINPLPPTCQRKVVRPDPDDILQQNQASLTDAFFNDPGGTNMKKIFATRLEVACSTAG